VPEEHQTLTQEEKVEVVEREERAVTAELEEPEVSCYKITKGI